MKLLRYGAKGAERPAILDEQGALRDLSDHVPDLAGSAVSLQALDKIAALDLASLPIVEDGPRIGAALTYVPNFFCVGLNYTKHAEETGATPPTEPILFSKASSALSGPNDPVIRPKDSVKLDYEVELGVVIGAHCEHVTETEALSKVAGYVLVNDVSERAFQIERGGQWIKGKSAPTFGPTGPWLVTADEIPDPQNLAVSLSVNGQVRQNSNTADMIFSVAEIISYMSRFMVLQPGDLIATGTPEGVGMGMDPKGFLVPGDVVELEIEGLGRQVQSVVEFGA